MGAVLLIKILSWFCSESRRWLCPRSGEPIFFRRLQGLCALVLQLGVQANSTALNKGPAILLMAFFFFSKLSDLLEKIIQYIKCY